MTWGLSLMNFDELIPYHAKAVRLTTSERGVYAGVAVVDAEAEELELIGDVYAYVFSPGQIEKIEAVDEA